ncbi:MULTISPECIES: MurT ligase domain-containing protein [unclassified Gordonia (in: high G+C Gram-positive bacteria)]|uniref:MurT ligase domain-containing protein n=1 Tax=unclassified Gordonia (in: high G+C Gram-positive bacteria) TaxID=2657482 RepID=UPI0009AD599C|nr:MULTISPECIES: MurT ligase domain-containing protein [unclassified Gordonia (in: high G+C Gram-positive bacteria)]MDF3281163.1 MurT ligase domain-containing protein [Gordonia sp. N1V]OPX16976.1 UDP-N-acetylmuramyl peptide synthase [Gordonia sp. i37]
MSDRVPLRTSLALAAAASARWASRTAGRGKGSMIGGLVAEKIDPQIMGRLAAGKRTALITGTNGKSTTTRMTAAALAELGEVATQADGANMDAGIIATLSLQRSAPICALEVDELHVPHVADATDPEVVVMLNLSRDQLDRVGEINMIERALRAGVARHPDAIVVANCDDVLVTSAAFDAPKVVWVAAGSSWVGDSVSCPRTGEPIARATAEPGDGPSISPGGIDWYSTGDESFRRPTPDWWVDDNNIYGPDGFIAPMTLAVPGRANRGNATQAVAAAVAMGADPAKAVAAVQTVGEVAGRYGIHQVGNHSVRTLLAKNPAGWQEALSMIDHDADGLVIAVNGQVPDGEDLSWLWDVRFEAFETMTVVAAGERAADLSVRLLYAGAEHTTIADPMKAIASCPPGRVEVLANYTAFRDLGTAMERVREERK